MSERFLNAIWQPRRSKMTKMIFAVLFTASLALGSTFASAATKHMPPQYPAGGGSTPLCETLYTDAACHGY